MANLPEIINIDFKEGAFSDWSIELEDFYAEEVASLLDSSQSIKSEILLCQKVSELEPYKVLVDLKGTSFLLGVYPERRKLYLAGPRLSNELFLIKCYELYSHYQLTEKQRESLEALKNHCEQIGQIKQEKSLTEVQRRSYFYDLPQIWSKNFEDINSRAQKIGEELLGQLRGYRPSLFERFSDYALGLCAHYALIRVHLLKFLALLPCLEHDKQGHEVKRNFLESIRRLIDDSQLAKQNKRRDQFRALDDSLILLFRFLFLTSQFIPSLFLARVIRYFVRLQAKRFIAGESIENISGAIKELSKSHRDVTLDQLGELVVSEAEAIHYLEKVKQIIKGFDKYYSKGEKNASGIYRAHVSIKVSALSHDFRPYAFDYTYSLVAPKLKEILLLAKEHQVFVNIDAEHYHFRDVVFKIYKKVLLETKELHDFDQTGIVIQAYLKDGYTHFQDVLDLAKERTLNMPIRLVKGAYWDAETIEAQAHNFIAPQFLNKEESDIHFRQLVFKTLENHQFLTLCLASHNYSDHCWAKSLRELRFNQAREIEHQCLHMTYEALSVGMGKQGWCVRNYIPIGDLIVGMAYLVRRIMENSSQVGVLTIMRSHKKDAVFYQPSEILFQKVKRDEIVWDTDVILNDSSFFNNSPARLYLKEDRDIVLGTLTQLKEKFPLDYSLNQDCKMIFSPSQENLLVGKINFVNQQESEVLIERLFHSKSKWWSGDNSILRYSILFKVAQYMRLHRAYLSAVICYEAGKTIEEALADVDEAVDFIHFYVREDFYWKRRFPQRAPRGIVGVIAPWNFPLAIATGMSCSALAAGNKVIFKSSEKTPLIAQIFTEILYKCGVPKDIFVHAPGDRDVGEVIVASEKVNAIIFTGSKAVGESIYKKTASTKRVVAEMGGKNAVIVTNNCELDETIQALLYSSFAHAGQKCSAASRIIIDKKIKDSFLMRYKAAVNDLKVGESFALESFVNPLITEGEKKRVLSNMEEAIKEANQHQGKVHVDRSKEALAGHCVGPVVIELPAKRVIHKESWAQREIFAPVVHLVEYETLDEAIYLFNEVSYALTGGVFAQSQDDIDYLLTQLEAGNLYVNRSNTGARVAIEPFGGFKLSGTGPKAGFRDYLKIFYAEAHLNEQVDTIESGSDYDYDLPRESKLLLSQRLKRVKSISEEIYLRYESFFHVLSEVNKERVGAFFKWLANSFEDHVGKEQPNHFIPGQLSYNNKSLIKKRGMLLCYSEIPSVLSFYHVFSALSLGCGLNLFCRNQQSFSFWSEFANLCYTHGISEFNLKVYFASEKIEHKALSDKEFDFVIIDASKEKTKEIIQECMKYDMGEKLKSYHTNTSAPCFYDWEGFVDQYIHVRSMAVNTLRYGAPMEIQF